MIKMIIISVCSRNRRQARETGVRNGETQGRCKVRAGGDEE
jgi:hypothetical protein